MAKIDENSIAKLKALFQDNEKALGSNFSQLIDFFNDNKVTDNGDGTYSVGDITLDARKLYNLIISGVTQQQLATKVTDLNNGLSTKVTDNKNGTITANNVSYDLSKTGLTPIFLSNSSSFNDLPLGTIFAGSSMPDAPDKIHSFTTTTVYFKNWSGRKVQIAIADSTNLMYFRVYNAGEWHSWTLLSDDSKVVHSTDMRKPANDVAGIEEVNAKQDKIGYTPADDSKVVHNSGAEEISGQKTFDVAPIDKTTGNPYITKADVTTKADTSAIDPSVLLGAIPITSTTDLFTLDPGTYFGKAVTPVNGPAINSLPATNYFWVKMETTKATASIKKLTWTDNGNNHYTNDYYGAPAKWHSWQVPNAGTMATKSDVTTAISTATANMADVSKTNTFSKQQIFSTNPTNGTQVYPIYATVDTDADATTLIASLQSSGFSGIVGVPES